jgi:hypothetical protein
MDDTAALIQRLYDEASHCELFGITKPAALLREAAETLQHAANMQAIDEFAEVTSAGHLSELVDDMRRQLHMLADEWEDHTELDAGPVATTLREIAGDKPPALPFTTARLAPNTGMELLKRSTLLAADARTEALRAALAELLACHTESAGWSVSMLANRAEFDAMIQRSQQRLEAAMGAARQALGA